MVSEPRDNEPESEHRALRALMGDVELPPGDIADRQIATARQAFVEGLAHDPTIHDPMIHDPMFKADRGAVVRRVVEDHSSRWRRVSALAAAVALGLGFGWWLAASPGGQDSTVADSRPLRGLTPPCAGVTGVYLGETAVASVALGVFVESVGRNVTVTLVDVRTCSVVSVLP